MVEKYPNKLIVEVKVIIFHFQKNISDFKALDVVIKWRFDQEDLKQIYKVIS